MRAPWGRGERAGLAALAFCAFAAFTGCRGVQSVLDPAGPQAQRISSLWWLMLAVCTAVFLIVSAFLFIALFRRRRAEPADPETDRGATRAVAAGAVLTLLILAVFLVSSVAVSRTTSPRALADPLIVEVIGHQWWWRFVVHGEGESDIVETANELHLPAGKAVRLDLKSRDVIHSFWVPNLQGKTDLIPGRTNTLWLRAERPGVYRGQCAELCGLQHAHMAFLVVVEPAAQWRRWIENQRRPARAPQTAAELRGQRVFLNGPCVTCHRVRGTGAFGRVAPDLTHLASRRTLAAATLPNRRGHLAGWVLDSQHVKPGNHMPPIHLGGRDLQDLLTYLESLE